MSHHLFLPVNRLNLFGKISSISLSARTISTRANKYSFRGAVSCTSFWDLRSRKRGRGFALGHRIEAKSQRRGLGTEASSKNKERFAGNISISMAENGIKGDDMNGPGSEIVEKKANKVLRFIDVSVFLAVRLTSCFLPRFNPNLQFSFRFGFLF